VDTRVVTDDSRLANGVLLGPFGSSIVEPMRSRGQLQGMVAVASRNEDAFSADSERLVGILAGQAVIALENEAMFRRMANLAIRDGLTGLFNHRHFYDLLQVEFERSERYDRQFSVLMIDTDSLKTANDTFGHLAGDQVLRELAILFLEETRESDVVARYGGDEFALILPETQTDHAVSLAERLRRLVEQHEFMWDDARIEFTISVGVTTYVPGQGVTLPELVGQADKALYHAKSLGKNRVSAKGVG
jgi:diguanylate cyclase (GGDEF)-like protein